MTARRTALLLVAGLLLVACSMRSPLTGVGPLLPVLSADSGLGAAAAGALTSLPLLAFAGCSPFVPRAAARWGTRGTLVAALVVLVAGGALRWVPGAVPLFAGTALVGAGIAVANVLLPALVRAEFPGRTTLLTSGYVVLMQVAGSLASGVAVPLAQHLSGGWRTALAVWAAPALAAALLWLPLVRGGRPPGTAAPHARPPWRSPLAWAVTAFMGLQSVQFYVLLSWLPTVLHERSGADAAAAGWLLSLMQVAGVVGSLLVPVVTGGSATRARRAAVGSSLLSLVGVVGLVALPHAPAAPVALTGLGMGGSVVLALAAMSSRAADGRAAVSLSGMAQSLGYLAAALGPVLIGAVHTASGTWTLPLLLLAAVAAVQPLAARAAGRDAVVPA
ncbi:MFS transporter [Kineococcus sp. SYSU DK006]|uniref:MFS transporter n=1 Tax=Kineococcus sp. SYSU DK006 TaxID=3383127 RepID=UPI003D7DC224